jgi:hypothetical protein
MPSPADLADRPRRTPPARPAVARPEPVLPPAPSDPALTPAALAAAAVDRGLGVRVRIVLDVLSAAAIDDEGVWRGAACLTSQQLISGTGLHRVAVREVVASLLSRGWLRRERVVRAGDTRSVYHLVIPTVR